VTKFALLILLGLVTLSGCATQAPPLAPEAPCAAPVEGGTTDGGYGGTGNAPEDCPPAQ